MEIWTVINHKGGVGKTTTAVSLLSGLSSMGKRVLAIDLDGQANLTFSLGLTNPEKTIYNVMVKKGSRLPIYQTHSGFHLVPSCIDLHSAEIELSSRTRREFILKTLISQVEGLYDYIIIDCPPSLGLLTINALTAATSVIIPVEAETLALQGMQKLLSIISEVQDELNVNLSIKGILITKYDGRKILCRNILKALQEAYPSLLFETKIRDNVSLAEAPLHKKNIFDYAPQSYGAKDYQDLIKEITRI